MRVALPPPRTVLGVYTDDLAMVAECLCRIVAIVERELLLQARAAALAAAPHKTVLVVCRPADAECLRRWLSSHCGLLSAATVRTDGVYLSVAIGPMAARIMWTAAAAKCAQRAAAISRGAASTRMRVDEFVVYGASVLQYLLRCAGL